MVPDRDRQALERRVFPSEVRANLLSRTCWFLDDSPFKARERLTSYRGRMNIKLCWGDSQGQVQEILKDCGLVPIMVRVRVN